MAAAAEVVALLKDNLRFLPAWVHQIIDIGLAQSPMTIAHYFAKHQVRLDVLRQLQGQLDKLSPEALGAEMERALINSPEFQQMAKDATLGSIFRKVQAFQELVKTAITSDFRLPLLGRFRQVYETRQPERDQTDDLLITRFGLWFLRQNETVSVLLAHLIEAPTSATSSLDLFTRAGLKQFMEQSEPDRLTTLATMGRAMNVVVSTAPVPAPLSDNEPTDPGERYLHRQRSISNETSQSIADHLAKGSGDPAEIVRLYRETYEALNGPCSPEQLAQLNQVVVKITALDLRRRRVIELLWRHAYEAYVTKTVTLEPRYDRGMREKTFIPSTITEFAELDAKVYEALADKLLMTFEVIPLTLGHTWAWFTDRLRRCSISISRSRSASVAKIKAGRYVHLQIQPPPQ